MPEGIPTETITDLRASRPRGNRRVRNQTTPNDTPGTLSPEDKAIKAERDRRRKKLMRTAIGSGVIVGGFFGVVYAANESYKKDKIEVTFPANPKSVLDTYGVPSIFDAMNISPAEKARLNEKFKPNNNNFLYSDTQGGNFDPNRVALTPEMTAGLSAFTYGYPVEGQAGLNPTAAVLGHAFVIERNGELAVLSIAHVAKNVVDVSSAGIDAAIDIPNVGSIKLDRYLETVAADVLASLPDEDIRNDYRSDPPTLTPLSQDAQLFLRSKQVEGAFTPIIISSANLAVNKTDTALIPSHITGTFIAGNNLGPMEKTSSLVGADGQYRILLNSGQAEVCLGASGGPVFAKGELIGLVSAIAIEEDSTDKSCSDYVFVEPL